MKKLYISLFAAALSFAAFGQTDPNRMILHNADGSTTAMMTDRVESISFATVAGPVKAETKVLEYDEEAGLVVISVDGTADCKGWKYAILPETGMALYDTDAKLASYIDANCKHVYSVFPDGGAVDAPGLEPGSNYVFCTVGVDEYGTMCEVSTDAFQTPRSTEGVPSVDVTFSNVTENSFDVTLTPNDDCAAYVYVVYQQGYIEDSYMQYGSLFGCASIEEYIKNYITWNTFYESTTDTYDGLQPARTYQVSVVPIDIDGNLAKMQAYTVQTAVGVAGDAWVNIEQTEFMLMQTPNPENIMETIFVPHQTFWLTPNEATAKFRAEVFTEAEFDEIGLEAAEAKVKTEAASGVPDDMWFRYKACRQSYKFDPSSSGYILVAGKNFEGEWGAVNVLKFTTPDEVEDSPLWIRNRPEKPLMPKKK